MKLLSVLGTWGVLLAGTGLAFAADNDPAPAPVAFDRITVEVDETRADIIPHEAYAAHGAITTLYLNRCAGGCTIRPGWDSSINNTSSIIDGTIVLSQYSGSASTWNAIVQCVRDTYAPYGVNVTDQDPGNTSHFEVVVAGTSSQAGFEDGVIGVAPFQPGGCGVINNAITYAFANLLPSDVQEICWTVAQESAHAWGLEHEALAADPMTYIDNGSTKRFQNTFGRCGEYSADPNGCDCNRNDATGYAQNSHQTLLSLLGGSTLSPPQVSITSPQDGADVDPGFTVQATITDAQSIVQATMQIDGQAVATRTSGPWIFDAPGSYDEGVVTVTVIATDSQGTQGSDSIQVDLGGGCEGDACDPGDPEPADGELGATCASGADCNSGQCASSSSGERYCVEPCDLAADACPGGFSCVDAGGTGVCWPADGEDGDVIAGGCAAGGRTPTLPILLGAGLAALLLRRRRRV